MARNPIATALPMLVVIAVVAGCRQEPLANAAATPTPGSTDAPAAAPGHTPAQVTGEPGAGAPGSAAAPPFDVGKLPEVVARVNGTPIGKGDLLARADSMRAQMERMGAPAPPQSDEFYRAMLDQLIGSQLLYAEAKKRGLVPTDAEVAENLARLKARNPEEFSRQLAGQGITEKDLAADLAQNLAIQKLVTTDVTPGVQVSEEAAKRFYQQNLERMKRPAQFRVRHILVGVEQNAPAERRQAAKKKAEGLLARLNEGADFAALAGETSDDRGSKGEGGLLPWMGPGETVPPFEKAALALEPGKVSGVVESPFGFHILRLEEKRAAGTVPFEEARPQIEQLLSRQQARDMLEQKVAALRKAAKVEVLF